MKSIKLIIGIIVAAICLSSCATSRSTCKTYSSIRTTKPHAGSNTCASVKTKATKFDKTFNY